MLSAAGHGDVEVSAEGISYDNDVGSVVFECGQVCIKPTEEVVVPPTEAELAEAVRKDRVTVLEIRDENGQNPHLWVDIPDDGFVSMSNALFEGAKWAEVEPDPADPFTSAAA